MLPVTESNPPFRMTRASHVSLTVTDLAASRDFYRDVIGLVVTAETADTVYLRGLEEAVHHSLTLHRTSGPALAERVGFRVATDEDIDRAEHWFAAQDVPHRRVEVPFQGPTLQFEDPVGTHMELTSSMDVV
jgi:catechol 2,3-dioxygenase